MSETKELQNKRFVLGVSGGVAAYKAAELLRLLVKAGASVRVVMTEAATHFITPVTMQCLVEPAGGAGPVGRARAQRDGPHQPHAARPMP